MARKKEAKLNCIGFMQEFEREYWKWNDAESAVLEDVRQGRTGIEPMVDIIRKRLDAAGLQVAELHAIKHDKDKNERWSDVDGIMLVDANPHIHGVVKFEKGKGGTINDIAEAIGLEPQYVEKSPKGRYAYDNMVSYLIHVKYENKAQYKPSEVYTAVGREYKSYCEERMAKWIKGRAAIKCKEAAEEIDDLEEKILQGDVTRKQALSDPKLYAIYARNRWRCDEAFDTYSIRKAVLTEQALRKGEFKLTVFFICGEAGAGKTSIIANQLIERVIKHMSAERNERWTCYKTAATNSMDKYDGSEIILMDDVRGGCMLAEDWLHLLDPYNITEASARYHNKLVAPRLLIITSVQPPIKFFSYCKQHEYGSAEEPFDQFLRRIQSLVDVMRTDEDSEPMVSVSNSYYGMPYNKYIPHLDKHVVLNYSFPPTEYQAVQTSLDFLEKTVMFNNLPKAERERILLEWTEECTEMWGAPPNVLQEWALIPAPDENYVSNMTETDALAVARASLLPTVPIG